MQLYVTAGHRKRFVHTGMTLQVTYENISDIRRLNNFVHPAPEYGENVHSWFMVEHVTNS